MTKLDEITKEIQQLLSEMQPIEKDFDFRNSKGSFRLYPIISPDLLGYLFDKVLGFKVSYRIFEKMNYLIYFQYKDAVGFVVHRKMSFTLEISEKYKDEIIALFLKAKKLLEELFSEYSKAAIKNDNYMLPNEIYHYTARLKYFKNQITNRIEIIKQMKNEEIEKNYALIREANDEITYNTEAYVDIAFAYIEHILTLLGSFCNYKKPFENVLKMGWLSKFDLVFGENEKSIELKKNLDAFKQIYRNRLTHGMFSKEQKIHVTIDGLGNYPFYIGNQLTGFPEEYSFIDLEKYEDFKKLFLEFENLYQTKYELEKMLIDSQFSIHLNTSLYKEALLNKKSMTEFIERIEYFEGNEIDMDW